MIEQVETEHKCTPICRTWHETHPIRGSKPNSIPAGDPRHLNEEAKQRLKK